MILVTKFWKVTNKTTGHRGLACKDEVGEIHIFGFGEGFHHTTYPDGSAKLSYKFDEEFPVPYVTMVDLYGHITPTITREELKRVYAR
jgi:hypothetical protein